MGVGAQVAHRNLPGGGPLDAPGAEDAVGLAINQQRQHPAGGYCSSPQPLELTAKADNGSRSTAWMTKWTGSSWATQSRRSRSSNKGVLRSMVLKRWAIVPERPSWPRGDSIHTPRPSKKVRQAPSSLIAHWTSCERLELRGRPRIFGAAGHTEHTEMLIWGGDRVSNASAVPGDPCRLEAALADTAAILSAALEISHLQSNGNLRRLSDPGVLPAWKPAMRQARSPW